MFSRQRAPGLWVAGSVITPTEWDTIDENLSNAVDGDGGGTYAFGGDLVFGGALGVDFTLELPFIVNDVSTFNAPVTFSDDVALGQDPADIVTVVGNLDVQSGTISIGTALSSIGVNGFTDFLDDVQFDGDVDVRGGNGVIHPGGTWLIDADLLQIGDDFDADFVINSGTGFYNSVTFHSPIGFATGGYAKSRLKVISSDADLGTYSSKDYDEILITDGWTPSFGATLAISNTGIDEGAGLKIVTANTAGGIFLNVSGGGSLGVLLNVAGGSGSGTHMRKIEARKTASGWIVFDGEPA